MIYVSYSMLINYILLITHVSISTATTLYSNEILKSSNNFDKFQDLWKLFRSCTIQFSRKLDSWLDLYDSVLASCSELNYMNPSCVSIHTLDTRIADIVEKPEEKEDPSSWDNWTWESVANNQTNYIEEIKTIKHSEHRTTEVELDEENPTQIWNFNGFEDISPVYPKIFTGIKLRRICFVHLPSVKQHNLSEDEPYFFQAYDRHAKNRLVPPDYIIVPVLVVTQSSRLAGYFNHKTKILLLQDSDRNDSRRIHFPCVGCPEPLLNRVEYSQYEDLHSTSLIEIHLDQHKLETLDDIASLWYGATLAGYMGSMRNVVPEDYKDWCPFRLSISWTIKSNRFSTCIRDVHELSVWPNCSSYPICKDNLRVPYVDVYDYVDFLRHRGIAFLPYGAQLFGVKYSIFVKQEDSNHDSDFNLASLVAPITVSGWIQLTVVFLSLGWILSLKKAQQKLDSFFWLFSTLLEQGDDLLNKRNKVNWYLILLWIFAAFLLRNVYTSSQYSYMTMEPALRGIPKNFSEMTLDTDMSFFTGKSTYENLKYIADGWKFVTEFQKEMLTRMDTRFYYSDDLMHTLRDVLLGEWERGGLKSSCVKVDIVMGSTYKHDMNDCRMLTRFAFLYETDTTTYETEDLLLPANAIFYRAAFLYFGQYKIFEDPNEQVQFSNWMMFKFPNNNVLSKRVSRALAAIVESGIHAYQMYWQELLTQAEVLDYVDWYYRLRRPWSYFTIAIQAISKYASMASKFIDRDHLNWDEGGDTSMSNGDVKIVWAILVLLSILSFVIFIVEYILQKCWRRKK